MPPTSKHISSKKNPSEQKIRVFEQRYGRQATELAAHAAFPLTLTTDLIYCLRETFLPECPWYHSADVLLSGLCNVVGYDLYEMDVDTRRCLLGCLKDRFGESRIHEVERFMVAYLRHRIKIEESDRPLILGEKPRWTSLACLRPGEAYTEIKQTLQQLASCETEAKERFRLAALVESYDPFLQDYLADLGYEHILLDWADQVAEGEPIDETAELVEELTRLGWGMQLFNVEVTTLEMLEAEEEDNSEESLQGFEFETVTVNDRGEVIETKTHQGLYFSEPLASQTPPLEMVAIPEGVFWMGSPEDEKDRYDDESPQHKVNVSPFFISQTPITQAQWRSLAERDDLKIVRDLTVNPSDSDQKDHPVVNIGWQDAIEFCGRLSRHTGRNYRLPTEAEWEYACRGVIIDELDLEEWNQKYAQPFYFGETITSDLANYIGTTTYANEPEGINRGQTTPVRRFPPNALGLYDLHGNVWEWCLDPWHEDYRGAPNDGSVWDEENKPLYDNISKNIDTLLEDSRSYVIRGGSYVYNPRNCCSAYRNDGGDLYGDIGFRVVCVPPGTS